MKLTVINIAGDEEVVHTSRLNGKTFRDIKDSETSIKYVEINGKWAENWLDYKFTQYDEIKIWCKTKDYAFQIIQLIITIVATILSIVLAPKPPKPSSNKSQPALGVAGIQNTVAPGTPKFISYGTRRIFGHLIASKVDVVTPLTEKAKKKQRIPRPDTGRKMSYSALYFMGVGQVADIYDVKLNGTHLCDIYGPPEAYSRLGTSDQTIIPGHELVHQTYSDNRQIEIPLRDGTTKTKRAGPGTPITYTTKGKVDRLTLFFQFPQGLWGSAVHGELHAHSVGLKIERKKNSDPPGQWTNLGIFDSILTKTTSGFFWKIQLEMPEKDVFDIKINLERQGNKVGKTGFGSYNSGPSLILFNVMETQFIQTAYPGNALLEIHGIGNEQINSFDSMAASAIVDGRLVEVLHNGIYTKEFTRNRVWITRDILLNRDVGLGHRLSSTIWDNAAGLAVAQYYEQTVTNFDGDPEQRDYCDIVINEIKPGWDHIKSILYEGRAVIIPSNGKLKIVLDKDLDPDTLYSFPGNIIDGSLEVQTGSANKPVNTVRAEFADVDNDYKVVPAKLISPTRGDDPESPLEISFNSIVRKSHAAREMNFRLKQQTLIRKRWVWKSPRNAVQSEPLDVARLAYKTSQNLRGYTGFVQGDDSSASSIATGKEIYLEAGNTYSIIVRQDSTIEERTVTNISGNTYSIINLNSPLSFDPKIGDIWIVGKSQNQITKIQIDDISFDGEVFTVSAHEHIAEVYDDTLGDDITEIENGAPVTSIYPPPLLDAQALVFSDLSGITRGYLFNVVPNFSYLSGTYSALSDTTIVLHSNEPDIDDFFIGASIEADLDSPRKILDYEGSTRTATVDTPFILALTQSATYNINWPNFSEFYGFSVEGLLGLTWHDLDSAVGTSLTYLTGSTYTSFRFTPFNTNEVGNTVSQTVVSPGVFDSEAPNRPLICHLDTDSERSGILTATMVMPLERDTQYLETIFQTNLTLGDTFYRVLTDISVNRDEKDPESPFDFVVETDLSAFDFGTQVTAKTAVIDFFGNKSPYTTAPETIVLSANESQTPERIEIETDGGATETLTGASRLTIYEDTIDGGTIGDSNSIELDLSLLVTPGSTISTYIDFHFLYAGLSASTIRANIADNTTAIDDDSPYSLSFKISSIGTANAQAFTIVKNGDEIPVDFTNTSTGFLSANSNLDQDLQVLADIIGDTTTTIELIGYSLTQFIDNVEPDSEPYLISGTFPGHPRSNTPLLIHPFPIEASLPANLAGSLGYCITTPGATLTISLKRNNVEFGTMIYHPGITNATFNGTQTSFLVGDILQIVPPDTSSSTIDSLGWSLYARR